MDRQHRRDLKHDKFVDEVGVLTEKARDNQRLLLTIASAIVAVALIGYGIYFYRSNREDNAQAALAAAIETIDSPLLVEGAPQQQPNAKFKTEPEKVAAAEKLFRDIQEKFSGSDASDLSNLYLARIAAGKGDVAGARKHLESFVANHPDRMLVGSAQYSLFQLRIEGGEAAKVASELDGELKKSEGQILPADSLLALLAAAYDAQGNGVKSRETYRRIITEYPDSPFALEAQRRVGAA